MAETVSELIAHILFHAEAEAADSDPSQKGDVRARIEYVRDVLADFKEDERKLDKYDLLREVSTAASLDSQRASFKRMLANVEANGDVDPRAAIQEWVARGNEDTR